MHVCVSQSPSNFSARRSICPAIGRLFYIHISVDTNKCDYAEKLPILETGKAFLGIGLSAIEKRGPDDVIKAPGTWFRVGEGFRTSFLVRLGPPPHLCTIVLLCLLLIFVHYFF